MVQWLRLWAPNAEAWGSIPGLETRSHMSQLKISQATRTMQDPVCHSWDPACVCMHFSHVRLFATLWTVGRQTPLSMGFSRQEYWSELPCSFPGDLPNPGIKPSSFMFPALTDGFFTTSATFVDGDKGICSKHISRLCGHKLVGYFLKQRKYSYPQC